jgi:hypothetical protein
VASLPHGSSLSFGQGAPEASSPSVRDGPRRFRKIVSRASITAVSLGPQSTRAVMQRAQVIHFSWRLHATVLACFGQRVPSLTIEGRLEKPIDRALIICRANPQRWIGRALIRGQNATSIRDAGQAYLRTTVVNFDHPHQRPEPRQFCFYCPGDVLLRIRWNNAKQ